MTTTTITPPGYGIAPPAYTVTARVLHWLIAALVMVMIPVGVIIANEWGGAWQERLYNLHKSVGAVLIPLILARLLYRVTHRPAPLPADIPGPQRFVANANHWAMYILLVVQPFLGWIGTSAYPAPVSVFGLFNLPQIWPANRALSDQLFAWHRAIGITLGVLVAMHVAGALYHHLVRRDRVLMRMITGG